MKTIKLTDTEVKVLDQALNNYIYDYMENIGETEKSTDMEVLKNTDQLVNILNKLTN